ncbi:single-stranded-DNA-specific exonuclease RecJ [Aestuariibacter salexigens]|uniref:single-stranded-DNA-specific exonuclease RecJ n=1 Tax=Aestuariibacter salexigens TaxID=226010 RepID=UPI0004257E78|nr:single-stranded-DNA-specific exonuclease RecJ [Aestuariibacter salexigens]
MTLSIVRRPPGDDSALPAELHPLLRRLYASRGVKLSDDLERSLQGLHHYQALDGIQRAVARLITALEQQQRIVIIGDFDADGATSTALCMLALRAFGANELDYLVPNRFDYGYGLSPEIVEHAHQQGAQLLVTVDSGIACITGAQRAKELGIDVIITDHHLPGTTLPEAAAIVNPNLSSCAFPSKNLAGVGVAFYLMSALRAELQKLGKFHNNPPTLAQWLDIVALGTVADVVKLDGNNRILVYQGLQRIRAGRCRPGIRALLDVAERPAQFLTSSDLGFVLGPRLNAAGRLDDMSLGIECLLTDSYDDALNIARRLDALNKKRKHIESTMQQEAETHIQELNLSADDLPPALVLFNEAYHQGVIGIVAGRIKEKYYRPTIVMAAQDEQFLKGSARSIPGVHIRDLLEEVNTRHPRLLAKFGGHAMAAGLSIARQHLSDFEKALTSIANEWLQGKPLSGELLSDGEVEDQWLTLNTAKLLADAGPWGQGFEAPMFDGEFAIVQQRLVGEKHLKLVLRTSQGELVDAIAFNIDPQIWPDESVHTIHAVYRMDVNRFRGEENLQLIIEALAAQ